jgi:release factor glutamine methyltransferase
LLRTDTRLPRHEAELLAAHALGITRSELWSRAGEPFDSPLFDELVARRLGGEPLAYITGSTEFHGIEIACGPGVLVPRPETEILVDVALAMLDGLRAPVVVDIGTGTGAIALAVAKERPEASVWATELSDRALAWAERNLRGSQVHLVAGDLFAGCPRADLVVSNPPYVVSGAELPGDVMREPAEALFAGPDGCDVLDRIVEGAAGHGAIALEIGTPEQAQHVAARLASWSDVRVHDDLTGRPRVVGATC